MTAIVQIKTKKLLKQKIQAGEDVGIDDPSIVNPRSFFASELAEGESVVVTNHPKRSYFATIKKTGGKLVVT